MARIPHSHLVVSNLGEQVNVFCRPHNPCSLVVMLFVSEFAVSEKPKNQTKLGIVGGKDCYANA
jgi:hypothetical protein